jgi:hypothetical protein
VKRFLLIFILIFTISCQKEDMVINQYKERTIDSTMVQDTVSKKLKLYEFVDKVSIKKEPVKVQKKKRFRFIDFIKSKFRKS